MQFRSYNQKDNAVVSHILQQHWTDPDFLQEISSVLSATPGHFYVVEDIKELTGVIGYRELPNYFMSYATIHHPVELYIIASKYQHKGIGSFMMRELTQKLKTEGVTEIICYSPATHRDSWDFYMTCGFAEVANISHPEDGCEGCLFKKIL